MATAHQRITSGLSKQSTDDLLIAYSLLDHALYAKWNYPSRKSAARVKARNIGIELRGRGVLC
jgi:hypothetical protein